MKDDRLYLIHILECIGRVEEYVKGGLDTFMESTLIQDAVMRNLQMVGESARSISEETKDRRPEVDWRGIIGFRNVIVHDYFGVRLVRVWEVVEHNLPTLKDQIEAILEEQESAP